MKLSIHLQKGQRCYNFVEIDSFQIQEEETVLNYKLNINMINF